MLLSLPCAAPDSSTSSSYRLVVLQFLLAFSVCVVLCGTAKWVFAPHFFNCPELGRFLEHE